MNSNGQQLYGTIQMHNSQNSRQTAKHDGAVADITNEMTSKPFGIVPNRPYKQTEVAQILNISEGILERWRSISAGKRNPGPAFVKLGRSVSYLGSDILAWIEANRVASDMTNSA